MEFLSSCKKNVLKLPSLILSLTASILIIAAIELGLDSSLYAEVLGEEPAQLQLQNQNQNGSFSLTNLLQSGSPHQGNLSSPIILIDFGDFQCYLCNRYVKNTEPLLNRTYVQTGKVALFFKHLPNRGTDSEGAAMAAQCTNDQGRFWQFHNLLYSNQMQIDSGWVSKENLKKFASKVSGIDLEKFNSCLDGEKYKPLVGNNVKLALSIGFRETPSFVIVNSDGSNPEYLQGALPFPSFATIIDKKLAGLKVQPRID